MPFAFRLDVFHHVVLPPVEDPQILNRLDRIMTTQAEHALELAAVAAGVAKIGTETQSLIAKIADLEAAVEQAGNVTPEVEAAMVALKAQVVVVDDLVKDAPVEPPIEG